MADPDLLFKLILVALTFVVIGMFFIVYIMIIGEREKKKLMAKLASSTPQKEIEAPGQCQHFLGYLAGYPPNHPIPDECFGCVKAVECMNKPSTDTTTEVVEPTQKQ